MTVFILEKRNAASTNTIGTYSILSQRNPYAKISWALATGQCAKLGLTIENVAMKKQEFGLDPIEKNRYELILDSALDNQDSKLKSIEMSLQTLLEVASRQRKMLRPVHWGWIKAMPIRRLIARMRGRST
jgi:hypothetical protein